MENCALQRKCRTYGACEFLGYGPALTRWAMWCRAYGAVILWRA